ncbi:tetratricopeptide repeat protein [Streptomyces sp. NBC_01477]|uniref:tetratricopeptide repeat protein n=1 Tax=Streptomyces sp. NBC_01477 TaxID=2976015 RepID=UPI002E345550|nr:tetratricopeptide repeat protein [Streptomyces sp. NBC_01477]
MAVHTVAGGFHQHHHGAPASGVAALRRWQPVADCDPLALGVHRARPGGADAGADALASPTPASGNGVAGLLPPYVPRDVDEQVRHALRAVSVRGGMVLLTGDSTSGKSRTALEAVRAVLPGHLLLAPPRGADLRPLHPAEGGPGYGRHVLWLDDLEGHLGPDGLEPALLSALTAARLVVVATLRDERFDTLRATVERTSGTSVPDHVPSDAGIRVLDMVQPIVVPRAWSAAELERVTAVPDERLAEAHLRHGPHGIAEYLAAGPELLEEWLRAVRPAPRGGHPRGAALVAAAVDLARIGLTGDVPERLLRAVHPHHLDALGGAVLRPEPYEDALDWAARVRYGVASLLMPGSEEGTWRPFDYLVDAVARVADARPVPDAVWLTALESGDDRTRPLIALAASWASRWAIAETAWRPLAESGDHDAIVNFTSAGFMQRLDPEEIEPLLRPVAEAGHLIAQLNLGAVRDLRNDPEEAGRWYEAAATAGLAPAAANLAMLLRRKGEDERAETWLVRAAEGGHAGAFRALGSLAYKRGDLVAAEEWWRKGAEAGDDQAAYAYGSLVGLRDEAEGVRLLRPLAEGGHDLAAARLAHVAEQNDDLPAAERWWRVAAQAGHADAANELGVLLSRGGDRTEGARWYARAAEAGHEVAMFNLAVWLADQGDSAEAAAWYQRAGAAGHLPALNNLGLMQRAEGDPAAAEATLRRGSEGGDLVARRNLIDLLISTGRPAEARSLLLAMLSDETALDTFVFTEAVRRSGRPQVAAAILRMAADSGRVDAALNLANQLFRSGDLGEAERWWRVAAPLIPSAANNLGVLLAERGEYGEAARWWRTAEESGYPGATLRLAGLLLLDDRTQEAEARLRQVAEALPEAACLLGRLLLDKPGGSAEGERWLLRAGEAGDADAAYEYAVLLAGRDQPEQAEAWCRSAAQAGNPSAARTLGQILASRGELAEAETWLATAVEAGIASAEETLALVRRELSAEGGEPATAHSLTEGPAGGS